MKRLRAPRLIFSLLISAPLAFSQQSPQHAGQIAPDDGYVSEGIYVNRFFEFTYRLPLGLTPQNTTFKKHPNDPSGHSIATFILLLAATPVKPYKNVTISVQDASNFKDGTAYLLRVEASAKKNGLSVLNAPQQETFAGTSFFRQDHYAPQGDFYQTHVCTVYKGYALDFVFSAKERADIEHLFNSLNTLQFDVPEKGR